MLLDDGDHSYVYGPSSTPIAQIDNSTDEVEYLHSDLLGSPRLLTDATGATVGSVSFDAFGNRASSAGQKSAFGFTGNWTDSDTGLVYLRARDYDPATAQFLSVDPAVDVTKQPYAYAGNNPISRTDPTGLDYESADPLTELVNANPVLRLLNSAANLGKHIENGCEIGVIAGDAVDVLFAVADLASIAIPGAGLATAAAKALFKDGAKAFLKTTLQGLVRGSDAGSINFFAASQRRGGNDNLASEARTTHILDGEVRPNGTFGGGHRPGTGFPNKSEFPMGWSDGKIMHEISDIATDPTVSWVPGTKAGDFWANGTRDGIDISVLIRKNQIWTAYPTNVARNP